MGEFLVYALDSRPVFWDDFLVISRGEDAPILWTSYIAVLQWGVFTHLTLDGLEKDPAPFFFVNFGQVSLTLNPEEGRGRARGSTADFTLRHTCGEQAPGPTLPIRIHPARHLGSDRPYFTSVFWYKAWSPCPFECFFLKYCSWKWVKKMLHLVRVRGSPKRLVGKERWMELLEYLKTPF